MPRCAPLRMALTNRLVQIYWHAGVHSHNVAPSTHEHLMPPSSQTVAVPRPLAVPRLANPAPGAATPAPAATNILRAQRKQRGASMTRQRARAATAATSTAARTPVSLGRFAEPPLPVAAAAPVDPAPPPQPNEALRPVRGQCQIRRPHNTRAEVRRGATHSNRARNCARYSLACRNTVCTGCAPTRPWYLRPTEGGPEAR